MWVVLHTFGSKLFYWVQPVVLITKASIPCSIMLHLSGSVVLARSTHCTPIHSHGTFRLPHRTMLFRHNQAQLAGLTRESR